MGRGAVNANSLERPRLVSLHALAEPSLACPANPSFATRVTQLKMHYFSGGAFESLIASQLLKEEKFI